MEKCRKKKINALFGGLGRNVVSFLIMALFSPTIDYFLPIIGKPHYGFESYLTLPQTWGDILWMAIGSGIVGVISQYYVVQQLGSEKALTSNYLVPVIGSLIGLFYYGEWKRYHYYDYIIQFGGTLVVVIGLLLCSIEGLLKKLKEDRRSTYKGSIEIKPIY
jgi:drug/metabolite transporter (DMT)-like permease